MAAKKKRPMSKDNIVVFWEGSYYNIPKETWMVEANKLKGAAQGPAKLLIAAGGQVGYVPEKPSSPGTGGYSCIIDLNAIQKN